MKASERKLLEIKEKAACYSGFFGPPFVASDWSELLLLKFMERLDEGGLLLPDEELAYANCTEQSKAYDKTCHSKPKKEPRFSVIFSEVFKGGIKQFFKDLFLTLR